MNKKRCRNNNPKRIHGKEYGEEYDNEEDIIIIIMDAIFTAIKKQK